MRYSEVVFYLFIVTKGDLPSFSFKSPINQGSTFFAIPYFINSKMHNFQNFNISEIQTHSTVSGIL